MAKPNLPEKAFAPAGRVPLTLRPAFFRFAVQNHNETVLREFKPVMSVVSTIGHGHFLTGGPQAGIMPITDTLRAALAAKNETLYALSRDTGVNRAVLRRFLAGEGIASVHLDTIAEFLNMELCKRKTAKRPKNS